MSKPPSITDPRQPSPPPSHPASRALYGPVGPVVALFLATGALHVAWPEPFLAIIPPYVPYPVLVNVLCGCAEVILALLACGARTRPLARVGLIALLCAVFPANVHMALFSERYPHFPPALLYARLPLQLVLIVWVARALRPRR